MKADRPRRFLGGLTPRQFMERHWQKTPLFVPGALPDFTGTLDGDELAGLAGEELADSRIVIHQPDDDRWQLQRGPFDAAHFVNLPQRHWTLLVTGVDQWHAETEALLEHIDFLPRWRVDDIMVSYAAPGGSVGPHVDQYDVFLLQGTGRRRWQIGRPDPNPPLLPDHELAILAQFQPEQEWVAQPGDLLYLPPGVPHYGVALEPCMTFSLGMRAPALTELVASHADCICQRLDATPMRDPRLAPVQDPWQLTDDQADHFHQTLEQLLQLPADARIHWLGRLLTGKPAQWSEAGETVADCATLQQALSEKQALHRAPWVRLLWHEHTLFIDGQGHQLPAGEAKRLCHAAVVDQALWQHLHERTRALLCQLWQNGLYALGEDA